MVFMDPKTDFAFKRLFGDQKHSNITINFLNHVLNRQQGARIVTLTFNNTENMGLAVKEKDSVLDISCIDESGNRFLIEMERRDKGNFKKRAQFYASYAVAQQIGIGENYNEILPVIFIGILNYNEFEGSKKYLSHQYMIEKETGVCSLNLIQYYFIELTKFTKTFEEASKSIMDQWIYMIKNAATFEMVPEQWADTEDIVDAFEVLKFAKLSLDERALYIKARENANSEKYIAQTAEEKGIEKGIEKGLKKGIEKGLKEGRLEIARNMLAKKMSHADIAQLTGLSVEEVASLLKKS